MTKTTILITKLECNGMSDPTLKPLDVFVGKWNTEG
jgi:hypothetical protein